MKKYIVCILMLGALLFALCGCGGSPLAKAYESLTALQETEAEEDVMTDSAAVEKPFDVQYDEENEVLQIDIRNGTKPGPIFKALYEAVDGKDIGTLIFTLDGTKGDDYEKNLVKKIGGLPCNSMERLGLNYHILDYDTHAWLPLAEKTEKLYLDTNYSVFAEYNDKERKSLSKFKDVQSAYEPDMRLGGIGNLSGIETFTFVPAYTIQPETEEDVLDKVTEDNPYLEGSTEEGEEEVENALLQPDEETTAAAEEGEESAEGEETAPVPIAFDYYTNSNSGIEDFARLENLKTLFILPDTGYELTNGGQIFIKSLQYLKPDLQVNKPGEAGTENTVAITDVETPDITEETAAGILGGFLKDDVEEVYNACVKYKKADGDAVLNGKSLIYAADPSEEDWGSKRKYSSIGTVQMQTPEKEGIKVPEAVGDYQTFVYIYPTYKRTGVYTSGTKAYSQTLHVQVFDMVDKVAYSAKSVGTAAAPQSFSYYVGNVPDKHSGEVDINKAYDYLAKLKTK